MGEKTTVFGVLGDAIHAFSGLRALRHGPFYPSLLRILEKTAASIV